MAKNDGQIVVHIPSDLQEDFKFEAKKAGTDMSGLGRELFMSFLDEKRSEYQISHEYYKNKENCENS